MFIAVKRRASYQQNTRLIPSQRLDHLVLLAQIGDFHPVPADRANLHLVQRQPGQHDPIIPRKTLKTCPDPILIQEPPESVFRILSGLQGIFDVCASAVSGATATAKPKTHAWICFIVCSPLKSILCEMNENSNHTTARHCCKIALVAPVALDYMMFMVGLPPG
jgi:hypothetical protein